eukprot:TRINITY_DN55848_c0_g1_i1.p1 TRINITY_DN55848_c0_g1~~TRINITY_DN55848_c0_g1_i1.p1  ORF type:complete len:542 (+),score=139.18 TRINITY_DN55848_c0_g1_i1:80-1627(+)
MLQALCGRGGPALRCSLGRRKQGPSAAAGGAALAPAAAWAQACGLVAAPARRRRQRTGRRWQSGQVTQEQRQEQIRKLEQLLRETGDAPPVDRPKIPVTVITGFLGAGKTTLLNHVLRQPHGKRLGVIENEYGEVGVDDALVPREKGEESELFELNNGCVCCTVRGDLVRILSKLAARAERLDGVIIETTGLANPLPITQTFFQDPVVSAQYELDGVVAVVDAKHVERHLDAVPETAQALRGQVAEAVAQVAFADRVLLNKTDLVGEEDIQRIQQRLRRINAAADIVRTQQSQISPELVLSVGGFDPDRVAAIAAPPEPASHGHGHSHGHSHEHGHGHSHGRHDPAVHSTANAVTSVALTHNGDMVPGAVRIWLDDIVEAYGDRLFRHKGVIAVRGRQEKFVFQGVHDLSTGPAATDIRWDDGPRQCRMVFIGKDLDREFITAGFSQCIAPAELRFAPGERVRCRVGGAERVGTVAQQWEPEFGYPYRVRVDATDGGDAEDVFVTFDEDSCIAHL